MIRSDAAAGRRLEAVDNDHRPCRHVQLTDSHTAVVRIPGIQIIKDYLTGGTGTKNIHVIVLAGIAGRHVEYRVLTKRQIGTGNGSGIDRSTVVEREDALRERNRTREITRIGAVKAERKLTAVSRHFEVARAGQFVRQRPTAGTGKYRLTVSFDFDRARTNVSADITGSEQIAGDIETARKVIRTSQFNDRVRSNRDRTRSSDDIVNYSIAAIGTGYAFNTQNGITRQVCLA